MVVPHEVVSHNLIFIKFTNISNFIVKGLSKWLINFLVIYYVLGTRSNMFGGLQSPKIWLW